MKRAAKRTRVRGTIAIIASLLLSSALLRVSLSATEVMADSKVAEMPILGTNPEPIPGSLPSSRLLHAMLEREKRVVTKEKQLEEREKVLDVAQFEIERRLEVLEQAEVRLTATLANANTAAENDVNQLIQVYENMKPKDTAALFETMEPAFAAGFLGRMRPEAAAGIMAGLSPKVAYTISVILAGRNANAPKS